MWVESVLLSWKWVLGLDLISAVIPVLIKLYVTLWVSRFCFHDCELGSWSRKCRYSSTYQTVCDFVSESILLSWMWVLGLDLVSAVIPVLIKLYVSGIDEWTWGENGRNIQNLDIEKVLGLDREEKSYKILIFFQSYRRFQKNRSVFVFFHQWDRN